MHITPAIGPDGLQETLDAMRARHGVVGSALGILHGPARMIVASGLLNVETGVEARADALFQVGSITKLFTATLAMQLVDAGRIRLDDPVCRHLPEFQLSDRAAAADITVRHLLNHTSGIDGDFFPEEEPFASSAEAYVRGMSALGQLAPVGRHVTYCNAGWVVLGRLVEKLSGLTWSDALVRNVLRPLGARSSFVDPCDAIRFRCAVGHHRHEDGRLVPVDRPYLQRSLAAAGSVLTMSAGDLLAFAGAHIDDGRMPSGERLLSEGAARRMREDITALPAIRVRSGAQAWGLGWHVAGHGSNAVFGHDGGTMGQFAYLRMVPERQFAVVLLTNSPSAAMWADVEAELLVRYGGVRPSPAAPSESWDVQKQPFVGRYENLVTAIEVHDSEDGLTVTLNSRLPGAAPAERYRMRPLRPDVFELVGAGPSQGTEVGFLESDPQGRALYVRHGMRMARRSASAVWRA